MPPKRTAVNTSIRRPAKRARASAGGIGSFDSSQDFASSRLVQAAALAERAGGGQGYLSRRTLGAGVKSLREISVQVAARGLYETVRLPPRDAPGTGRQTAQQEGKKLLVGWDPSRDPSKQEETSSLRHYLQSLPVDIVNRLLGLVLSHASADVVEPSDPGVSVLAVAALFFHPATTRLALSSLTAPSVLISRIPQCNALADLDLSFHTSLSDGALAKVLVQLPTLERVNLKGCTKVGDASLIALSRASEERLKVANLSLTAVSVKGLTELLSRCKNIEVLKLASVAQLNEKNVNKLVEDATSAAPSGYRHFPLSRLRALKLRSTDITDASIGRLLTLCALSLTSLDVSYTSLKSLDFVSSALHALPAWNLEKLVVSGLPLSPASLEGFFRPLSERPVQERKKFRILKLGAIPVSSTKAPGLTDAVLAKVLPYLEKLEGLESVSLYQNWGLGKTREPLGRFMETVGRRCLHLDLTLPVESHHLERLLSPLPLYPSSDENGDEPLDPDAFAPVTPRLQTLVLDSSRIRDDAAEYIAACRDLRALHVAETRISTKFLLTLLHTCPHLSTLNLTSCRGVPVTQRRTFFEAYEKGEVSG
ncbi:hypothetical protein JCM8547_002719 [Rhodosporidiobolus lusitaniae]